MTQDATASAEAVAFEYPITVEAAGPATKKVSIEIPEDRISGKLKEAFTEFRKQAAIPGFRVGHAPQKLIEKRFATDIREQVRRDLVGESYQQAIEKNKLQVLGEPEFPEADKMKLPETGALSYSFTVEVQPEITLPDMTSLTVKKPKLEPTEANVDQALQNLREQQGKLIDVTDRGIEDGDYLLADVHIKLDGAVVHHQHDAQLVARAGRIAGIQIEDFAQKVAGAKAGESRTFTIKAPDDHAKEEFRGKDVEIDLAIKQVKKLELAQITPEFLDSLGFTDEKELREALREQLDIRIKADVQQNMREQVNKFLLDNITLEVPAKLSASQTQRVVQRRLMDLINRGVPAEQIEPQIEQIKVGAEEEGARELKLFFILQKIAADQGTDVEESELNGRIAMMAMQRNQRPEKLKQEMSKDGSLSSLYLSIREQKALDKVLETAVVEEVEVPAAK